MPAPSLGIRMFLKTHTFLYKLTSGAIGGSLAGLAHVLVTTKGAKSGIERTIPLACYIDGDRYLIVASNNGEDYNPAWWHNLNAHPEVPVQYRKQKQTMRARTLPPEERAQIWPAMTAYNRMWGKYETRTERPIPVVELVPLV